MKDPLNQRARRELERRLIKIEANRKYTEGQAMVKGDFDRALNYFSTPFPQEPFVMKSPLLKA